MCNKKKNKYVRVDIDFIEGKKNKIAFLGEDVIEYSNKEEVGIWYVFKRKGWGKLNTIIKVPRGKLMRQESKVFEETLVC